MRTGTTLGVNYMHFVQRRPIQCVSGLKQQEREVDHSPPSSAEDEKACSYTCSPPIRLHLVVLN